MRAAAIFALLLLAGCAAPGHQTTNHLGPFDIFELHAATAEDPLHIYIYYEAGRTPQPTSLAHLQEEIKRVFQSGEVLYALPRPLPEDLHQTDGIWSTGDRLELKFALVESHDTRRELFVVFLAGRSDVENEPIGLGSDRLALIFPDQIDGFFGLEGPTSDGLRTEIEKAITLHEVGHVLGLVGRGIPVLYDRVDQDDPSDCNCHSANPDSVMRTYLPSDLEMALYHETEGLLGHAALHFDEHDLADLHNARAIAADRYATPR